MAITTGDQAVDAIANRSQQLVASKASITNTVSGQTTSMWRATGVPAQGAIPTTWAVCHRDLAGAYQFTEAVSPVESYLTQLELRSDIAPQTHYTVDRLAHMGGLVGNVATAQTVNADLSTLLASENLAERIGNSNYSEVNWYLEWYTDTGATGVTVTINVTYDDGTTGNLSGLSISATVRAARLFPLNYLIPAGVNKQIRGVNTVTLSATTGAAGNFGVTAMRNRGSCFGSTTIVHATKNWVELNLPKIYRRSCLHPIVFGSSTQTGGLSGNITISNG